MSFARDDMSIQGALQRLQVNFVQPYSVLRTNSQNQETYDGYAVENPSSKVSLSEFAINRVADLKKAYDNIQEGQGFIDTAQKGLSYAFSTVTNLHDTIEKALEEGVTQEEITKLNDYINKSVKDTDDYIKKLSFNGQNPVDGSMKDGYKVDTVVDGAIDLSQDFTDSTLKAAGLSDKVQIKNEEALKKYSENLEKVVKEIRSHSQNLSVKEIKLQQSVNDVYLNAAALAPQESAKVEDMTTQLTKDIMKAPVQSVKMHVYNMDQNLLLAMFSMRIRI